MNLREPFSFGPRNPIRFHMVIEYMFKFEDGKQLSFKVDPSEKKKRNLEDVPEWVNLGCEKCSNCPLNEADNPVCPVALELHEIVDKTADMLSYKSSRIVVKTIERSYFKDTDLQSGLFSLLGLIMANCDCPHFSFLKPLAKFHLPFSNIQETLFRSASTHLLQKFFENKANKDKKIDLLDLLENYKQLEIVNKAILERIKIMSKGDANKNAIVCLNIYAQMFSAEFDNEFEMLEEIFKDPENEDDGLIHL